MGARAQPKEEGGGKRERSGRSPTWGVRLQVGPKREGPSGGVYRGRKTLSDEDEGGKKHF